MAKSLKIPKRKQKRKSNKDRQHSGQKLEDTKEKTEAVNLTRIDDNTMAKSLKIPRS